MKKADNKRTAAKFMLFFSAIIWGSSFFILKNTLDEVPVFFTLAFRFLFAGIIMSIVFFKKWKLINRHYIITGAITGVFLALAYIFQTIGLTNTTPGTNAFLTTVYTVLVPFILWIVIKRKPNIYNILSAIICITGIGMVCLDTKLGFSFMGEGMTLICGFFFALQIVAVDIWGEKSDIILHTIIQFFTAFIVCAVCLPFFEKLPTHISLQGWMSLGYITVFATAVAFIMMNVGITHTDGSSSSLILCLESVFGVLFSILFYHEELTLQIGLGFFIIFIGIVINEAKPFSKIRQKRKIKDGE